MLQEYFIRQQDGCTLDTESERHKLTQCLIAAIERRVSHVCTVKASLRLLNSAGKVNVRPDSSQIFKQLYYVNPHNQNTTNRYSFSSISNHY